MAPVQRRRAGKSSDRSSRDLKRKREVEDIQKLIQDVADLDVTATADLPQDFAQLPLSQATQDGLRASHFTKLTTVQARGIPHSLKGSDVLGAAKTGSGKTLAFLVPVLENLYRKRWTDHDGLGALILSPTRELAIQIFEVLRKVGRNHAFSAGLVIGGKSLLEERDRLGRMNILVATPGRMLQHLDQTSDLDIGNLLMLVLDEADRIMDMGFQHTVDAIVEHLPKTRQTLMFSATQTKRVSDLARLSLQNPEFVSVHENAETATPASLVQNYVVTPLPEKLDTLWSFLRANAKKKTLVFLSSGKQVRFIYEAFRHLQPGVPLLHLHGRQKQTARLDITTRFSNAKYACLFSTDVAARGLDFPAVDWVVQVDCPEDADTYIHRVGRTARYEHDGRAVIFLDPSEEEGMLKALEAKKVTEVEKIHVRQKKMQTTVKNQLQNMCFKDPELKYLGQKAFASYVRSVFVQKDKSVFDVKKLDLEAFADSLGLPGAPRVKFVKGEDAKARKNMPRALAALELDESSSEKEVKGEGTKSGKPAVRTKYDRMFERRNQDVLADHYSKMIHEDDRTAANVETVDADEDDGFMSIKQRFEPGDEELGARSPASVSDEGLNGDNEDTSTMSPTRRALMAKQSIKLSDNPGAQQIVVDSKRRAKLLTTKRALLKFGGRGSHLVFSDDSDAEGREKVTYEREETFATRGKAEDQREQFLSGERERVKVADDLDREVAKQKRREKKIKRKEREKAEAADNSDNGEVYVQVGNGTEVEINPFDSQNESAGEERRVPSDKRIKKRKWFEDVAEEDDDRRQQPRRSGRALDRFGDEIKQPQTLEELETMATELLAR